MTGIDSCSAPAIGVFGERLRTQLAVGVEGSCVAALHERALALLEQVEQAGFGPLSRFLEDSGVRTRWNAQLARQRPAFLALWIAPLLAAPALDLLCGDGALGRALARATGGRVDLVERRRHRDSLGRRASDIVDFARFRRTAVRRSYDTVVLCTVLHHEAEPEKLLAFAAGLARRRVVIVENCIDPEFPADYQQFMDLFFNRCLNRTALPAPGQHRTIETWLALSRSLGDAFHHGRTCSVPGIPLAHDLIVLELDPS